MTGYQKVHMGLWCLTSCKQTKSQAKASLVLLLVEPLDVLSDVLLIHWTHCQKMQAKDLIKKK